MFLKKLYRFNKIYFLIVVFYLCLYLFLNFKGGLIATPALQMGMFSQQFYMTDTQTIFKIYANNKLVNTNKFKLADADYLEYFLQNMQLHDQKNKAVYQIFKRLVFDKLHLGSMASEEKFTNPISSLEINYWLKMKIAYFMHEPINQLEVYSQPVIWHNGKLIEVGTALKLNWNE